MPATLGNDIVDLIDADNKLSDKRFMDRVFSVDEQHWLKQQTQPHCALWTLWAAKEAAFKAYQKQFLSHRFSPIQCLVSGFTHSGQSLIFHEESADRNVLFCQVMIGQCVMACEYVYHEDKQVVEVIAVFNSMEFANKSRQFMVGDLKIYSKLQKIKTDNYHNQSHQSHQARQLACDLLYKKTGLQADIHRPIIQMDTYEKKGPPCFIQNEKRLDYEVSLSHDGGFVGVAVMLDSKRF